jgi:hypothetical protein
LSHFNALSLSFSATSLGISRDSFAKKEKQEEKEETGEGAVKNAVLSPEQRELLEQMEKVPLLNHELMAYYYRFKLQNKELFQYSDAHSAGEK